MGDKNHDIKTCCCVFCMEKQKHRSPLLGIENTASRREYLVKCLEACENGGRESFTSEFFGECAYMIATLPKELMDTLDLIAIRLRASAREAEKEGDARREIALLRALADLECVVEGKDIVRSP